MIVPVPVKLRYDWAAGSTEATDLARIVSRKVAY
jgi:hypothetical protein